MANRSVALVLLFLLTAWTTGLRAQSAASLPAFDLGYAEADLVLVASSDGYAGNRVSVTVHLVLKGLNKRSFEAKRISVIQPRGYGLHVRLPVKAGRYLLFLKKTATGYLCLQRPGIQIPVPKNGPRERALLALFRLLKRSYGPSLTRAHKQALSRDLSRFARRHTLADPLLAEAALLTLARRPDLAPLLGTKEIQNLRTLLADPSRSPRLRDLSARSLVAARDPRIQGLILAMLTQGKAQGLGAVFGRLLAAQPGPSSLQAIAHACKEAKPQARSEIRRALGAFRGPAAKKLRESLK